MVRQRSTTTVTWRSSRFWNAMFEKIMGSCPYKSPDRHGRQYGRLLASSTTKLTREASKQEIIRRYYNTLLPDSSAEPADNDAEVYKLELLMKQAGVTVHRRQSGSQTQLIRSKQKTTGRPGGSDPASRTAASSPERLVTFWVLHAAILLNALKAAGRHCGRPCMLISPDGHRTYPESEDRTIWAAAIPRLHTDEVLIALSICAATDETAKEAIDQLQNLAGTEFHSSVILSQVDMNVLRKLGINVTCEPNYESQKLYHR